MVGGRREDAMDGVSMQVRDGIAEIVLDRAPVNAISARMYVALTEAFGLISSRTDVRVVVLRSDVDRGFSAGADIRENLTDPTPDEPADEYRQRLARTCYEAILECVVPTIAVVHGFALGAGAVIGACCDIRIGAHDARIGLPEIDAGRCGGGRHLMRLMPQGAVRLLYFTGEPLDADEAHRLGYLQAVHPRDRVVAEARALAARIAAKSPLGIRLAKQALDESESLDVKEGYRREQQYTLRLGRHPDAAEAVASTLERRPPRWTWPAEGDQ